MLDLAARLSASLGDRYRVERQLGAGGMATVFLAQDLRHGRPVAVKVIRPELAQAMGAARFVREIRVTAGLTHPNIPPLLDSGEADGLLYYVMPYLRGATLADKLRTEGRLGVEEALLIGWELADALAYAHRAGVVHRDVKPSNVFLEEGHALLGDFGVALIAEGAGTDRITSTELVLGTAEYMSPEQCSGSHTVDARSDIYSLGCLLYEALAGEPPFVGRTRVAVVARHLGEPPPPLTVMRGDVPRSVAAVVERCLAKAPADRFATAEALRDALDKALRKVRGEERTALPRSAGWAVGAVTLVAAVVGVVLFWPEPAPAIVADRVVGFPLADRGGGVEVGTDVALMIGNALLHTDPLKWVDGWERLTPEERQDPARVTLDRARSIALARGAGHFITGGIMRAGDSLTVRLELHDAAGDSVVGQAAATGRAGVDPPERLAVQAAVQILPPLLDPGRVVDLSPILDRDPAGIALWIQGDRAYRQARFKTALDLYRRAVETDSLLVFAAMKGARAASWTEQLDVAGDLIALAARHDSILPPRQRAYLQALRAYHAGDADLALAAVRTALVMDPDWEEAWALLGEIHQHLLPRGATGGDSARHAFEETIRLDPQFVPSVVHLAEYAVREGDLDRARGLLERLRPAGAEEDAGAWVPIMEECVGATSPRIGIALPRPAAALVLQAGQQLTVGGWQPACAEAAFRDVLGRSDATRDERWGAILGLQGLLVAEGREAELDSLLQEALASGEGSVRFVILLDAFAGVGLDERARAVDAEAAGMWGPDYATTGPLTLWALALWNTHEGDLPTARTLVARLREAAVQRGDRRTALLAAAAGAHLFLAAGDTVRALEAFRGLTPVSPRPELQYGLAESLAAERIQLAELLLARGEAEEAWRVAVLFDHPQPVLYVPFLPRSLAVRTRAAEASRGSEWARRARDARARLEALGRTDLVGGVGNSNF